MTRAPDHFVCNFATVITLAQPASYLDTVNVIRYGDWISTLGSTSFMSICDIKSPTYEEIMTESLKDRNVKLIFAMGLINAAAYEYVVLGANFSLEKWTSHVPAVLAAAIIPALSGLISAKYKEHMVFWIWMGRVPGCRAFSVLAPRDKRIDLNIICKKHGEFPSDPESQNILWYKLYSLEKNDPSIQSCNRNYLFTRDITSMITLFSIPLIISAIVYSEEWRDVALYSFIILVQYLVFLRSAIVYGERLVTTAMAVYSAREV